MLIGGNKAIVFNAEYYVDIRSGPASLAFYDAGQVRDIGEHVRAGSGADRAGRCPDLPPLTEPRRALPNLLTEIRRDLHRSRSGGVSAFKTSTGVEVRFFMPVLNMPFRLIAAYNPQRFGVLNNNLQPTPKFTVPVRGRHDVLKSGVRRFRVGTDEPLEPRPGPPCDPAS